MKDQFDIYSYVFPEKGGEHPAILISHPDICADGRSVNVLFCTSQRQNRQPYAWEVMLDTADGLDWASFVDCSMLYAVKSAALFKHRGRVTLSRRNAIRDKIKAMFCLADRD